MNKNNPIDYSQKANWYQIPEITKEFDTFYVYATEYIMGSMEEGAPDYADLDNAEMLEGAAGEYLLHATAYADSTNVFMPYYRQVGLRYAGVVWKRDGIFDAAIADMPYGDIVAALDYYFEHYNNGAHSSLPATAKAQPLSKWCSNTTSRSIPITTSA